MDIQIKEMVLFDLKKSGLSETLNNLRPIGDLSFENKEKILVKINSQDGHIFIAIHEDEIIGITTILIEQKFIRTGARVAHIEDVSTRHCKFNIKKMHLLCKREGLL